MQVGSAPLMIGEAAKARSFLELHPYRLVFEGFGLPNSLLDYQPFGFATGDGRDPARPSPIGTDRHCARRAKSVRTDPSQPQILVLLGVKAPSRRGAAGSIPPRHPENSKQFN